MFNLINSLYVVIAILEKTTICRYYKLRKENLWKIYLR